MGLEIEANRGVYFLANDAVLDWTYAFLNSFRITNPDCKLFLIPFDDCCASTTALAREYHFEVYISDEFERMEAIGRSLELGHTFYGPNWFRRYCAFWGPLDHFIYFDARHVVLGNVAALLDAPRSYGFDLVYSDAALDQVYEPGRLRTQFLRSGGAKGFMSNNWASRRGLFSPEDFSTLAKEMLGFRGELNRRNTDQAFINYCCDARGVSTARISELVGGLCASGWARQRGRLYRDPAGYWRLWDHGGLDHNKRLIAVHWAGLPFCFFGPRGRLLLKYGRKSPLERAKWLFRSTLQIPLTLLRQNRFVNQAYKRVAVRLAPSSADLK